MYNFHRTLFIRPGSLIIGQRIHPSEWIVHIVMQGSLELINQKEKTKAWILKKAEEQLLKTDNYSNHNI